MAKPSCTWISWARRDEVENFFRLLRQGFEFSRQSRQRLIERENIHPRFLRGIRGAIRRQSVLLRRQKREEQLRALAQAAERS